MSLLDSLTDKQLAKEFKATYKDVKSQDSSVKASALQKLSDKRYFIQGGCVLALLESAVPKKVILHYFEFQLKCC